MLTRTALLASAAALLLTAGPALAQDDRYEEDRYGDAAEDEAIEWQQYEVVQQVGEDAASAAAEAYAGPEVHPDTSADYHRPRRNRGTRSRGHDSDESRPESYHSSAPRLGYSNEQREAWLSDCRIVMRGDEGYHDDSRYEDEDDNGGLLGGLLGAVVGGVAGNRIGGSGDRLAGTLIGAGIGGIAGAVIGSAIGGEDDDRGYDEREANGAWAGDYCEAYLRRYEAGGQTTQVAYAQPETMHSPARRGAMREIIREEWVDVPAEQAEPHARQRAAPRRVAAERGKLTPVN